MSDKIELLEEYDTLLSEKKRLTPRYFLFLILTLIFLMMLAFPKIYLNQKIYYKSRDIAKLKVEYETLKEENKRIKSSVETMRFKNQILDTMF